MDIHKILNRRGKGVFPWRNEREKEKKKRRNKGYT